MPNKKIVLDTNCLLASISRRSTAYPVWKGFQEGRYTLCVTNEILAEYEEISPPTPTTREVPRDYRVSRGGYQFVDCAFAAGATYIVSDDSHFNILRDITFPQLLVLRLKEFLETLQKEKL